MLLIIDLVVFFSFMKITVNMEEKDLFQKAHDIIKEYQSTPTQAENILKSYLVDDSYLRIIKKNSKIEAHVADDIHVSHTKGYFSHRSESQLRTIHEKGEEKQVLIVRVPIMYDHHVVSTLEIGEALTGLELRKDLLLTILIVCSLVAIILSLLGGRWLSAVIMRPISNMIKTMEEIEQSGVPKKIIGQSHAKDELEKISTTFNRMIERIEENIDKQKQFVSDASHELKTPLTVIWSYANLLRRRGIKDTEMTQDAVEAIYSEAIRMQKITETLLDLASSERQNDLKMKSVDLIGLCQQSLRQLRDIYKRDIHLHFYDSPIFVMADELKIKQVFIILLDNAIKYSSEKIEVNIRKISNDAVLSVKDYGIGISNEDVDRIFERFYRIDKARSRSTGGTGLGLSIAKNIVKQHNGKIEVTSEVGKGTNIKVYIPLANLREG